MAHGAIDRRELDTVIRRVPEGRVVTLGALRACLARSHRADYARVVEPAALLDELAALALAPPPPGQRPAPSWRVVGDDGALLDRLPGGIAAQSRALAGEGVVVLHLGPVPRVTTIEHFGWQPPHLPK